MFFHIRDGVIKRYRATSFDKVFVGFPIFVICVFNIISYPGGSRGLIFLDSFGIKLDNIFIRTSVRC